MTTTRLRRPRLISRRQVPPKRGSVQDQSCGPDTLRERSNSEEEAEAGRQRVQRSLGRILRAIYDFSVGIPAIDMTQEAAVRKAGLDPDSGEVSESMAALVDRIGPLSLSVYLSLRSLSEATTPQPTVGGRA
jgi:hypothetical protein